MFRIDRRLIVMPAVLIAIAACNRVQSSTDIQTAKIDNAAAQYGKCFTDMADNAMLNDSSIADIHFIPHTSELSGLGVLRLDRMAKLLDTYGGTVRYETLSKDDAMVKERLAHVREYLTLTGCDMARVTVAVGKAGGVGMQGDEAVRKYHAGTVMADKEGAGTSQSFVRP